MSAYYLHTFRNDTLGTVVEIAADETGTWALHADVFTDQDKARGLSGHRLDVDGLNKLFAYWHAAGHRVRETSTFPTLVVPL